MGLIKPQNYWEQIPKSWLRDSRLGFKELGILCKLQSLPTSWEFSIQGLAAIMKDGTDSIRSGIHNLEELGYLTRQGQKRDDEGQFSGGDWVLHEVPFDEEEPMRGNKTSESRPQIEKERKEIIRKAKQEAKDLIQDTNATIENTIRQIKQAKADKEKTKAIRRTLEEKKSELNDKPKEVQPIIQTTNEEIKVGDNVVYGEHIGEVLSISGKKAVVALGGISSTINLNLLKKAKRKDVRKQEQRAVSALSSIETLRQRSLKFKTQLDIRGMRTDEAMQTVMYYIDDAMMVGVGEVRILHGTGTGALKQMVREYLSTVGGLSFKDEHVQLGGAGITVVTFR